MTERKYLPTVADLIDRLSITLMKSIFIDRTTYRAEMALLQEDILACFQDSTLAGRYFDPGRLIYAILALMLANRYIWENENWVRKSNSTGDLIAVANGLRATHSINGVRNRAKNEINKIFGERQDQKIDCLAADLPKEFGNWDIFDTD